MGLLNLTLAQLLAALLPLTAFVVALYFYDRSRRRVTVSTLRFWPRRPAPPKPRRQKKVRQPLSLLLQLLALLFLLLAIADWRWDLRDAQPRHHVLILDASAVMARVPGAGGGSLLAAAQRQALDYLAALPQEDRVALVRADALPTPADGFTADRKAVRRAILETEPGWTALDLNGAFGLARDSLRLAVTAEAGDGGLRDAPGVGEVVYVGPGRLPAGASADAGDLPYLRHIEMEARAADLAIEQFQARRLREDPSRWQVALQLYNDSGQAATARTEFFFKGVRLGERTLSVGPNETARTEFRVRTSQAGTLEARLSRSDSDPRNDSVRFDLPASRRLPLVVRSEREERLRVLLDATPYIEAKVDGATSLLLIDGSADVELQGRDAIYFNPPPELSPVPIARAAASVEKVIWNPATPLAANLRERDLRLSDVSVFEPQESDIVIASIEQGPIAVAGRRAAGGRFVVFGFDPLETSLLSRLTTPLLFANAVNWFAPEVFQAAEFRTESPGSLTWETGAADHSEVAVRSLSGAAPIWIWEPGRVRLFSQRPGVFELTAPYRQARLTVGLPQTAPTTWEPPAGTRRGVPPRYSGAALAGVALWPWLTVFASALLAVDWRLFGRFPGGGRPSAENPRSAEPPVATQQEAA